MTFLNIWALVLLLPLLYLFRDIIKPSKNSITQRSKNTLLIKKQAKLLLTIIILTIVALSRPVLLNVEQNEKFDNSDYIIAIDSSFSMQADDLKPSRFEASKKLIHTLLSQNIHDKFTLFAFTTNPLLLSPPTSDTQLVQLALDNINPKYILTKGTSLVNLLKSVQKLPMEHKNLILFTDGGEESDITSLLQETQGIKVTVVAVASKSGCRLKKDNKAIYDDNANLVVSRINPLLKLLANHTKGHYIEFHNANDTNTISEKLIQLMKQKEQTTKQEDTTIRSYQELFYYPLLVALLLFFMSVTKYQHYLKFFTFLLLVVSLPKAEASVFDFYYLQKATAYHAEENYVEAAWHFRQLSPSQESYLNTANCYYRAEYYKNAMLFYEKIKTHDKVLKQKVFYGMGNCAMKLKKYDRAETYYQQALALGYKKEIYENLKQIYELQLRAKINVTDMLPTPDAKKAKNSSKKLEQQKDSENKEAKKSQSSNTNNTQAATASDGSSSAKKVKSNQALEKKKNYKIGYKAYELINEGYTNETKPW